MGRPPRITRDKLFDTARRVFAEKGFEATTLADIARQLHVTPAAVLRHVPTKQALFAASMRASRIELPRCITELEDVDASSDPRVVLRRLAEQFVPFVSGTIAENLAIYMHRRSQTALVLPFDVRDDDSPPRRGLRIVTSYFRRAAAAGVLRVRDPRAAALLFMGSLQSYVLLHQVFNIAETPYPLEDYLDALIDLWTNGAIGGTRGKGKKTAPQDHRRGRARGGGRGDAGVVAARARAEGARPGRNARGANGQRRIAGGRPRRPRPDR